MKLLEIDLGSPVPGIAPADRGEQWVVVRLHGDPVGVLRLEPRPFESGEMARLIVDQFSPRILMHLLADRLRQPCDGSRNIDPFDIPADCPRARAPSVPVTVAVCTRDRAEQLSACLDSLLAIDYPPDRLQLLIVDNAPASDATETLVRSRSPRFSYVREPRPGLNWARNRAVLEAEGAIVAFTDDDVSVDRGWVRAIAGIFETERDAMAVTGLVLPDELDEPAQLLFEAYGGFGRGFARRFFRIDPRIDVSTAAVHGGTGKFGTGANMAFRREVFTGIGPFDPALDVGTVTNGGGDLEMFFRVLKAGHLLVYEPAAVVRHRHRRDYEALRRQLANNGIGFYAYLVRAAAAYPDERSAIVRLGAWWFWYWNVRRLLRSFVRPRAFPRDLILAELRGSLTGLSRYRHASRRAAELLREYGPQERADRTARAQRPRPAAANQNERAGDPPAGADTPPGYAEAGRTAGRPSSQVRS